MNFRIVGLTLGILLVIESVAMLLGLPFSIYHGDHDIISVLLSSGITLVAGGILALSLRKARRNVGKREAYLIVTFGWIGLSLFGTLPFVISGAIPDFTNAFFETISGFTTTGASILNDIESLPHHPVLAQFYPVDGGHGNHCFVHRYSATDQGRGDADVCRRSSRTYAG